MVQKKTVETKDEHPPYFCVSKLSVLVLVSCDTLKTVSSPSQPVGWSLGRLATPWVMCLRLGLWPNALQHTDINSTDGFICFGTPCVHLCVCVCACTWVCLACYSVCECVRTSICERFTAVHVAICLPAHSLQHTLLVSIKYLSHADCPPALRIYNVYLYAAWDRS